MLRNYLVTTFRNLARNKTLALIYLFGLGVSIAACMLILVWIRYQLSFDKFNNNASNIYRVYPHILMNGNNFTSSMAPPPLADLMKREIPEVKAITRIWKYNSLAVSNEENGRVVKTFNEEVYQADSTFFDIFDYKFLQGDPHESMTKPFTIVITKSAAIKYFGEAAFNNGTIPGKALTLKFGGWGNFQCKITGITEDVPPNAHFHYNIIFSNVSDPWNRSQVWVDNTYYTYVLLQNGTDPSVIERKLLHAVTPFVDPQLRANFNTSYVNLKDKGNYWEYKLQPLTSIHLHSNFERELEPGVSFSNLYILGTAAVFLLLMACINYANISTANTMRRSKEIGIRKTLGSSRIRLVGLIFAESGAISLIAWLLAVVIIIVLLHPFEQIMATELPASGLVSGVNLAIFLALFFVVTGLGGIYPALYLSSFNAVKALKGAIRPGRKMMSFRSTLIVVQFFIFIALISCAIFVDKQLNFLHSQSPGFDRENILVLDDPSMLLAQKESAFVTELKKNTNVISANPCIDYPGSGLDNFPIAANYIPGTRDHLLANFSAGYDFLKTFDIPLLQGRDFNPQSDNDTVQRIILNEAAVKELGIQEPVNKIISTKYLNALDIRTKRYEIVGVARDFNFQSLHKGIRPIAIFLNNQGTYVAVRIKGGNLPGTIAYIKNLWNSFAPGGAFEYHFLDERVDNLYKTESVLSRVLNVLTFFVILVAVMGLTGLTVLTVQQRTKEIGIRKVVGASLYNIVALFSKEYIKWICLSFILATPVAYFFIQQWLQSFAYRITISLWVFAAAAGIAVFLALATIAFHAVKAGLANPVTSLKSE
ncbi:ABC transporter permease [Puia dinghuensis]|uniref:ABC transporter permease n=1 Tax=Puia dinghuensis TaxID=1792502 RepID=A0A8J2U6I3_9BACT|nr:ABC transporter permease [Puia dinghuensis]GGA81937.1 ABC transporter permease [Puia dinghuensis]